MTDQCFFLLTSKKKKPFTYQYEETSMSPGNWQKMVSRLRQVTNIWKANKYWKKGCPAFIKLTSLWRDGLALVEGVDQGRQENCGLWPVSWVIAKSVLLTLGADLDLRCEDRIWEVYPCRIFFLWGFGSWVCGRTITSTIKMLQNASACLLQAAPRNFPDSSLQELPCQLRHLLPALSHIFCGTKSTVASYLSSLVLREALAQDSWPDPRPAAAYLCSLSVLLEPLLLCLSNGSLPTHPKITTLDRNKAMGYPSGLWPVLAPWTCLVGQLCPSSTLPCTASLFPHNLLHVKWGTFGEWTIWRMALVLDLQPLLAVRMLQLSRWVGDIGWTSNTPKISPTRYYLVVSINKELKLASYVAFRAIWFL